MGEKRCILEGRQYKEPLWQLYGVEMYLTEARLRQLHQGSYDLTYIEDAHSQHLPPMKMTTVYASSGDMSYRSYECLPNLAIPRCLGDNMLQAFRHLSNSLWYKCQKRKILLVNFWNLKRRMYLPHHVLLGLKKCSFFQMIWKLYPLLTSSKQIKIMLVVNHGSWSGC